MTPTRGQAAQAISNAVIPDGAVTHVAFIAGAGDRRLTSTLPLWHSHLTDTPIAVATGRFVAGAPTGEQYDQLRAAVRQRLEQYQKSGRIALQAAPGEPPPSPVPMQVTRPRPAGPPAMPGGAPSKRGNAIYRVTPDGLVREVFRESTMILRIVQGFRALRN